MCAPDPYLAAAAAAHQDEEELSALRRFYPADPPRVLTGVQRQLAENEAFNLDEPHSWAIAHEYEIRKVTERLSPLLPARGLARDLVRDPTDPRENTNDTIREQVAAVFEAELDAASRGHQPFRKYAPRMSADNDVFFDRLLSDYLPERADLSSWAGRLVRRIICARHAHCHSHPPVQPADLHDASQLWSWHAASDTTRIRQTVGRDLTLAELLTCKRVVPLQPIYLSKTAGRTPQSPECKAAKCLQIDLGAAVDVLEAYTIQIVGHTTGKFWEKYELWSDEMDLEPFLEEHEMWDVAKEVLGDRFGSVLGERWQSCLWGYEEE